MKKLSKQLLKHPFTLGLIASLIALWLRFVYLTSKKTFRFNEGAEHYFGGKDNGIFCFWHGRMIMHPFINPPGRQMKVLISHHRDGEFITTIMARFGIGVVRGSSTKGAVEAMLGMQQVAADGCNIGITPDGPRGPAQVAAQGAAHLALHTGLPLVLSSFSATKYRRMTKSWDKFLLPLPFGELIFVAEAPFFVKPEDGVDVVKNATAMLEETLNRITREGDALAGMEPA